MISPTLVRELAEKKLEDTENYLVEVTVSAMNKIRVTIDNFKGISIQECVEVSRFIEEQLDRETEDYELEVSSPGLDQPFKVLQQYKKYTGREVEVKFADGQKAEGKLISANKKEIEIEQTAKEKVDGKKGKQLVTKNISIPFEQIKETKIIIKF
ncbi:MAG: ribosome assembly cofactor RimP [Bacteroidota bacterium]|nr:ribosome assembly cofactor RimP [Bacteroidota bacterium]